MSCWHGWHGWHGCGPVDRGPYECGWADRGPYECGWADREGWYGEVGPPIRRGYRRSPRLGREGAAEDLEARLDELRDEVRRVEAELMNLRADGDVATGAS